MMRNKENLIQFILKIYPMPRSQAEAIVEYFNEGEIKRNELIFVEGKVCKEYHFLDEGFIRAYTFDLAGNDITTAFYSSKQVVCEIFSFFKKVPSKENFQALADCHTWYISFDDLQSVFHSMPEFREFGRTILVNAYAQLKLRMLSSLHETAEERYKNLVLLNPDIFLYAPLKNIASYLGVTDSSLSRIRKEFTKTEKLD